MTRSAHARTARPSPHKSAKLKETEQKPHAAPASKVATVGAKRPDKEKQRALIAEAVHLQAKKRALGAGQELEDWLAAESGINDEPLLEHQLGHSDT
jgi:hypothetical protein